MGSTRAKGVERRRIAHRLLIELLAHQFAFPVKWIETQDELFRRKDAITRLVELGPSKILGGMAKRTVNAKYAASDTSNAIERRFLSSNEDSKDICYEYEPPPQVSAASDQFNQKHIPTLPISPTAVTAQRQDKKLSSLAFAAPSISDVPISAREIAHGIIANKIKKGLEQVSMSKSIKELSGGKSTLQNELLGYLGNEFGHLPDGAEDLPLTTLGDAVQSDFSSQLGKQSSSIVARLISSKMPAGFNQGAIRDHLKHSWGFGPARQAAILLFAITEEPASRLPSVDAAKGYFDALVPRYAASSGLILPPRGSERNAEQTTRGLVDPAAINTLRREQHGLISKQIKLFANYLQGDALSSNSSAKVAGLESLQKLFQEELDLWTSEFPEGFGTGIKPYFDSRKARRYNSSWNLVREDILRLYYDAENGRFHGNGAETARTFLHIANRSNKQTLALVESLTALGIERNGSEHGFSPIGRKLAAHLATTTNQPPVFKFTSPIMAPQTSVSADGTIECKEVIRSGPKCPSSYSEFVRNGKSLQDPGPRAPHLHIKRRWNNEWKYDPGLTEVLLESFTTGTASGFSSVGKDVLVTGAGPGSISAEVVRGLLMGGARVIVTTSRAPSASGMFYQNMYSEIGAQGSELLVLPFNQGSARDCEALIDHVYSESGLCRNLDTIIPFAAISVSGREVDELGAESELAHRLMMVNVLRLLGRIVRNKHRRNIDTRPTQVLLPLSPNNGTFGGDGLYSESKLGLEGLLNRFHSENWSDYLIICGASIGWTRGTGLMNQNDILAQEIESHGVITFSQKEMAFNLLALMTRPILQACESEPILADLNGGLQALTNLRSLLSHKRSELHLTAEIRRAVREEDIKQKSILDGSLTASSPYLEHDKIEPRSTLRIGFPQMPDFTDSLAPLQHLQGMVDPSTTIVIVGFSELGPWGSSRTRWEMEHQGEFSQEGYIEMAWIMNLIKHFDGDENGEHYVGYVDAKTGKHIHDSDVREIYGRQILEHSGIRLVEPSNFGGYDPARKEYLHEVAVEEDLPEFDATLAAAEAFKLQHGDNIAIHPTGNADECRVQIRRGAHIMVPKAMSFDGGVAGQIPKGWNPAKYGIPEDLIPQVDPVTLYALCCASEALYSAGIVDSLEIFKHIHLSELGNFIGSLMGGTIKTRQMYRDQYLDKQVQGDVLQETYLNTPAAWVNMLLLGSAGPIKTPVGACATAVESLDNGCESILSGKTKICFVGGTDNFQEDGCYAFSTMKATVNARDELSKGRTPSEMSRPTAETRAGFVESQGCGVQIITTAERALEMGLPIYGVIASSTMAADKISRSVPAPGQGVVSFARESADAAASPLLDIGYRREQMDSCIAGIHHWNDMNVQRLPTLRARNHHSADLCDRFSPHHAGTVKAIATAQIKAARRMWGNNFRMQEPNISPLRASLAVWGLTVDDIDIASLHGTSTKANDKNEPEVINRQMEHLGRSPGRPLLAICQKSLTGHPKAPAAAWMLNGCLQALDTGIIPGNRNADNVDEDLRKHEHLVFPTRNIHMGAGQVKAFLLTSFGFGQKGGQVVGVAPKYFFATLTRDAFDEYATKVSLRKRIANRAFLQAIMSNTVVKVKESPPYMANDETKVLLDPLARITQDGAETLHFDASNLHPNTGVEAEPPEFALDLPKETLQEQSALSEASEVSKAWIEQAVGKQPHSSVSVGIDTEDASTFNFDNKIFIERNYTDAEQALAWQSPDPHSTLVGRWCAKEAVFKSLNVASKGAGAPLKDIEILSNGGIPEVKLYGDALVAATGRGVRDIKLSLSHSGKTVIAVALAMQGEDRGGHSE